MKVEDIFKYSSYYLKYSGIEEFKKDSRLLISSALGKDSFFVFRNKDYQLSLEEEEKILSYIKRRSRREPVSRIIGFRDFWKLSFILNEETLDPRPDTETLVEGVIKSFSYCDKELQILDLGTGSGCILLSLLLELKGSKGLGIDISSRAISAAKENAKRNGLSTRVEFIEADWNSIPLEYKKFYDIVVSNPPYIKRGDISHLCPEVKDFDPIKALDGGFDGLSSYIEISKILSDFVISGGSFFCEIGKGQEEAVKNIFLDNNFQLIEKYRDLSGIIRCLHFKKVR